jgi:hypothetical protein
MQERSESVCCVNKGGASGFDVAGDCADVYTSNGDICQGAGAKSEARKSADRELALADI